MPTYEDIQARAGGVERAKGVEDPSVTKLRKGMGEMTTEQKILFDAAVAADVQFRDYDADKDASPHAATAKQLLDMVANGTLPKNQLLAKVQEHADTPAERDEILRRYFAADMKKQSTGNFEPPPERAEGWADVERENAERASGKTTEPTSNTGLMRKAFMGEMNPGSF